MGSGNSHEPLQPWEGTRCLELSGCWLSWQSSRGDPKAMTPPYLSFGPCRVSPNGPWCSFHRGLILRSLEQRAVKRTSESKGNTRGFFFLTSPGKSTASFSCFKSIKCSCYKNIFVAESAEASAPASCPAHLFARGQIVQTGPVC